MWILILFAHVGPLGEGNSNALTTAQFSTQQPARWPARRRNDLSLLQSRRLNLSVSSSSPRALPEQE
jgi:hypothetical protein